MQTEKLVVRTRHLDLEKILSDIPGQNGSVARRFDLEKQASDLSVWTRIAYALAIRSLSEKIDKPFSEMTKDDIVDWASSLQLAENTRNLRKTCIKRFFKWIHGTDVPPEMVRWLKPSKKPNHLPTDALLTQDDVRSIIEASTTQRDRAILMALWESACRASEVVTLKNKHVVFDKYGAVIIVDGKTGQRRIRLIDSAPDLQLWVNMKKGSDPEGPFWTTRDGRPLNYERLRTIVKSLAAKAGIKRRVHPHLFRHSRLTELAKDFSESELKIMAGWTSASKMAGTYVHLSGADIEKKILEKRGIIPSEEVEKEKVLRAKTCPRCGKSNAPTHRFCAMCSMPLDAKSALDVQTSMEVEKTNARVETDSFMDALIRDERVMAALRKVLADPEFKGVQGVR